MLDALAERVERDNLAATAGAPGRWTLSHGSRQAADPLLIAAARRLGVEVAPDASGAQLHEAVLDAQETELWDGGDWR